MIKEINTNGGKILVVEVPANITWWELTDNRFDSFITNTLELGKRFLQYGDTHKLSGFDVVTKFYNSDTFFCCQDYKEATIIGKLSELTDKDCEEFCDELNPNSNLWEDYSYNSREVTDYFESAKDSFISLLQSEGVDTSKEYLIIRVL